MRLICGPPDKWIMGLHTLIMVLQNSFMELHNSSVELHNSIMELLKWIMEFHKWIVDLWELSWSSMIMGFCPLWHSIYVPHMWPVDVVSTWWRHQMETFSALLALYAWNSPITGEFPTQRPVTPSFDVFFDLRLNKRLIKQSCDWWF